MGVLFEEAMNPFKDLFEDLHNAYNKVDKNFLLVILSTLLFINIIIDIWAFMSGAWPMVMLMLMISLLVIMAFLHTNSD